MMRNMKKTLMTGIAATLIVSGMFSAFAAGGHGTRHASRATGSTTTVSCVNRGNCTHTGICNNNGICPNGGVAPHNGTGYHHGGNHR